MLQVSRQIFTVITIANILRGHNFSFINQSDYKRGLLYYWYTYFKYITGILICLHNMSEICLK